MFVLAYLHYANVPPQMTPLQAGSLILDSQNKFQTHSVPTEFFSNIMIYYETNYSACNPKLTDE